MKKTTLALILLINLVFADSLVWQVEKDGKIIYLGGTVHILKKSDYPLPIEYEKAYKKADKIYFETDLKSITNPKFQQLMLSKMMLTDGQKLSTLLSKDTYQKLQKIAPKYRLDLKQLDVFKPSMIYTILTISELQRVGVDTPGVDFYFEKKSLKDGKKIGILETGEEQLNFLVSMGEGYENAFINRLLNELERTEGLMKELTSSWKNGDEVQLYKLLSKELKEMYPEIYTKLVINRNNNWMPIIKSMFENNQKEFVLVGAAHLLGEEGLIEQLKKEGYKVDKF